MKKSIIPIIIISLIFLILAIWLIIYLVHKSKNNDTTDIECTTNSDCNENDICVDNKCQTKSINSCVNDNDCSEGYMCSQGICVLKKVIPDKPEDLKIEWTSNF